MLQLVPNSGNPVRTGPPEVPVVNEHPAEPGRILLIQKQLELFFATIDIGGPQFAGQRSSLGIEFLLYKSGFLLEVA